MTEFYPCTDKSPIVEVIDENYVVVSHYGISIIYSVSDDMFNASKLVDAISSSKFRSWKASKEASAFITRFPHYFKVINGKGKNKNRISGTYVHSSMLNVIVSWANPMLGYCLANGLTMETMLDKSGYFYLVRPVQYKDSDVYKFGITWNTKQRFKPY